MPVLKFREAIHEAYVETMRAHPEVFLLGVGIIDPKAVFGTLNGIREEFGDDRFVEGPLAEQMLTGMAFGAATHGMRPVLIHHRVDFLPLTMDQIVSHAAKWRFMFGNQQTVPMVIRGIVGRGWGNGPQHTQSMQGTMAHIPGIKVVVPSNAADAKGLMISAIMDEDPVIYIEHRWNHEDSCEVPSGMYRVPIGKANVVRPGRDLTVVAVGPMVQEALIAASALEQQGHSLEVIDLRSVRPIDFPTIIASVEKTGRLIVADSDWPQGGAASTIISHVTQKAFGALRFAPVAITWPDHPVPASYGIEPTYYPMAKEILQAASRLITQENSAHSAQETVKAHLVGPF